jgi:DNA adenine methylase
MNFNSEIKRPALRYFGGKWRIAPWIISHFPPHCIYTEAYGGGASVLLRKPRAHAEIYNDLDGEISNVFLVLRDNGVELRRRLQFTPYSRIEFDLSYIPTTDPVEQARRTLVRSWMGYGGNLTRINPGGKIQRTGFRAMPSKNHCEANDWANYLPTVPLLSERLQRVIIERRPALEHFGAP